MPQASVSQYRVLASQHRASVVDYCLTSYLLCYVAIVKHCRARSLSLEYIFEGTQHDETSAQSLAASAKTPKRKKGADRDAHAKQVRKAYDQAAIASNTTPPPILGPSTSSSASVSRPIIMVTRLHYRRPNHCRHHSPTILSLYPPHINIRIQLLSAQPHSESRVSGIALHTFIYNRLYTLITYLSIY